MYLSTCCVGSSLQERIEAEIDEALATSTWVDVMVSTHINHTSVQEPWTYVVIFGNGYFSGDGRWREGWGRYYVMKRG